MPPASDPSLISPISSLDTANLAIERACGSTGGAEVKD